MYEVWKSLQKLLTIQSYLAKSTGELLMLKNIVRNDPLWSNVVLERGVIFIHKLIWIWDAHTILCNKGIFLLLFSCNFLNWAQIFSFVISCICLDIPLVFGYYQQYTMPLNETSMTQQKIADMRKCLNKFFLNIQVSQNFTIVHF